MNQQFQRLRPQFLLTALAATFAWQTQAGFLLNPSFEANYNDAFPHYSPIDSWTGGSGVNDSSGPFHNGPTPIPDQTRVAFLQGASTLSQDVSGLTTGKQYWIQFFYDARACCGGTIDLSTSFDGAALDKITNLKPATGGASYSFRNVPFTAAAEGGALSFQTAVNGDATALIDGVCLVQRDEGNAVVMNPGFEASGDLPETGVMPADQFLAGWEAAGTFGVVNAAQAGENSGTIPEQDHAGFLQSEGASISQIVSGLVLGTKYDLTFAYNAKAGNSPKLQVRAGDTVLFDETVAPVGGANPYLKKTVSFTAADVTARITFSQTAAGDQTVLLDDIRVTGQTAVPIPPMTFDPLQGELVPGQNLVVTLSVEPAAVAGRTAEIQLRSSNAGVLTLTGANEEGILALTFDSANLSRQFTVQAITRGSARVDVVAAAGIPVTDDVGVNVVTAFVRNPSFESTAAPGGVGVGPILSWNPGGGGHGINKAGQPFADNGAFPDRKQVGFIQGTGAIAQEIRGLKPGGNYWLQFRYNVRNCCGGTMDLTVKFGSQELAKITAIAPVLDVNPYYWTNVVFVPATDSGVLEFAATASGDATLLLDAITIVERAAGQIVIQNPSFEASGTPSGVGYVQPDLISGWDHSGGGYGVNVDGVGPFTDNGRSGAQDLVLFLQGGGNSMTQTLSGFTPNTKYTLIYEVNARNGGPELTTYSASIDNVPIMEEEISPVGGANPYYARYVVFTPTAETAMLTFTHTTAAGDHTLLLDDVRILPGEITPPVEVPTVGVGVQPDGKIRLSWPVSATGYGLQSAATLGGTFTADPAPVIVEGEDNVVLIDPTASASFYRLVE